MSTESLNIRLESSLYGLLKMHCVTNKITMTSWVQTCIVEKLGIAKPLDEAEKLRTEQEQVALEGAALKHELLEVIHKAIKELPLTSEKNEEQMRQLRTMALKFKSLGRDPVDGVKVFLEQADWLIQKGEVPVEILGEFKVTMAKAKVCMVLVRNFREIKLEEALYTMEDTQ